MTITTKIREAKDEVAMQAIGGEVANACASGMVIYLQGELGAGKTTFVRGFLRGLGITGKVKSPTYTLVEPYETENFEVFHFDLYRLQQPDELRQLDLAHYFNPSSVCLIEWPSLGGEFLPKPDLVGYFDIIGDMRHIRFESPTQSGAKIVARL